MKTHRHFARTIAAFILVAVMGSFFACSTPVSITKQLSTGYDDAKTYTYNTSTTSFGDVWNPHTWSTNADSAVMDYISSGLYEFTFNEDTASGETMAAKLTPEMASEMPVDVTSQLTSEQKTLYNVPSNATKQYAYKFKLNSAAKWSDGTAIKAVDYYDSLELLLNPDYLNSRADSEMSGDAAIAGAKGYFNFGRMAYVEAEATTDFTGKDIYASLTAAITFYGVNSINDYYDAYGSAYFTVNDIDLYDKWSKIIGDSEYYKLAGQELIDFETDFTALCVKLHEGGSPSYEGEWKEFLFYGDNEYLDEKYKDFGRVGIILDANDEYSMTIVYAQPVTEFNAIYYNTSTWLVKTDKYKQLTSDVGGLKKTTYNSSVDTTYSYGPYILSTYEADKEMVFTRNENWYGYSDNNHKGQYSTDIIRVKLIEKQATELLDFLSGKLEDTSLTASDLNVYGTSEYRDVVPQTYLYRFFYDLDESDLKKFDASSTTDSNTVALTSENFRLAISAAIDRKAVSNIINIKPAFGMISDLYTYDFEGELEDGKNYRYRDLDAAKQAILDIYNISYGEGQTYSTLDEAYNAITGYDLALAKELFRNAFTELNNNKETNGFNPDKEVVIRVGFSPSPIDSTGEAYQKLLNDLFASAIEGSGFKGFRLEFVQDDDRYSAVTDGRLAMSYGAIGGARQDPFGTSATFLDPDDSLFLGKDIPVTTNKVTLTYDFDGDGTVEEDETITKSMKDWIDALRDQNLYLNSDYEVKAYILARMEYEYLKKGYSTPIGSLVSSQLHSIRIQYPIEEYNQMIGFGGVRYMQYYYDDATWTQYVNEYSKDGKLQYV